METTSFGVTKGEATSSGVTREEVKTSTSVEGLDIVVTFFWTSDVNVRSSGLGEVTTSYATLASWFISSRNHGV